MTEPELVDITHRIAFVAFWVLLAISTISVSARVAYYRAKKYRRPRLLTRDAIQQFGFAIAFGLILFARVLEWANLRDSILWALATDVPALIAVGAFAWYELFVIEAARRGPSSFLARLAHRMGLPVEDPLVYRDERNDPVDVTPYLEPEVVDGSRPE